MSKFEEKFKTESDCIEFLRELRWPGGQFCCPSCDGRKAINLTKRRLMQCTSCRRQTSVTAGSIFHGRRVPLLKLFRIIWELATGQLKSAQQLALELEMRYSTVWMWLHKARSVVTVDAKQSIVIHWSLFERVLYRRSLESAAVFPESTAELPESSAELSEASREQAAGVERRDDQAKDFACPTVSFSGEPLAIDQNLLRASGAACEFISGIFGGISRKYLQQYLAQYALFVRRKKSFIGMLRRCQGCAPMNRKTLRQFCSAEILTVPVLLTAA